MTKQSARQRQQEIEQARIRLEAESRELDFEVRLEPLMPENTMALRRALVNALASAIDTAMTGRHGPGTRERAFERGREVFLRNLRDTRRRAKRGRKKADKDTLPMFPEAEQRLAEQELADARAEHAASTFPAFPSDGGAA